MGRIAGSKYRQVVQKLRSLGFEFDRHATGSHEIWYNPAAEKHTTIPNHPDDIPEATLRAILRQADVVPEDFLDA